MVGFAVALGSHYEITERASGVIQILKAQIVRECIRCLIHGVDYSTRQVQYLRSGRTRSEGMRKLMA